VGNVISGNGRGVILESDASGYTIQGNIIGLTSTGSGAMGNKEYGIDISTPNNQIGGTGAGMGNQIGANTYYGVLISDDGGTNNHVEGNFIGTNAALAAGLGNSYGVVIYGAFGNFIGGTAAGAAT